LQGYPSKCCFAAFANALPPGTRFWLSIDYDDSGIEDEEVIPEGTMLFMPGNVKELFCPNFRWLKEGLPVMPIQPSRAPVPIHASSDYTQKQKSDGQTETLRLCGYETTFRSLTALEDVFWASLPRLEFSWNLGEQHILLDIDNASDLELLDSPDDSDSE
jgi:hypothetical protein